MTRVRPFLKRFDIAGYIFLLQRHLGGLSGKEDSNLSFPSRKEDSNPVSPVRFLFQMGK